MLRQSHIKSMQLMKIKKQKLRERQRAWLQTIQKNLLSYRASVLEEKGENQNKIHQLKLKAGKSHQSWQRRPVGTQETHKMFLLPFPDGVRTHYCTNCPKKRFNQSGKIAILSFFFLSWKRNILDISNVLPEMGGLQKELPERDPATLGSDKLLPLPLLTLLSTSSVTRLIFSLVSSVKMFSWFRTKSSLSFWSSRSSMEWTLTQQKGNHHHHHGFPQERNKPLTRHGSSSWWFLSCQGESQVTPAAQSRGTAPEGLHVEVPCAPAFKGCAEQIQLKTSISSQNCYHCIIT